METKSNPQQTIVPGEKRFATCEFCRADGGSCHLQFHSTSTVPKNGEEDPEIHLGRTTIYDLMDEGIITYSTVRGKRVMDGESKCRYLRSNKNKPAPKRGGNRRKKKEAKTPSRPSAVGPAPSLLIAPPPPVYPPVPGPNPAPVVDPPAPAPNPLPPVRPPVPLAKSSPTPPPPPPPSNQ